MLKRRERRAPSRKLPQVQRARYFSAPRVIHQSIYALIHFCSSSPPYLPIGTKAQYAMGSRPEHAIDEVEEFEKYWRSDCAAESHHDELPNRSPAKENFVPAG